MDTTLREYLAMADNIHEYVTKFGVAIRPDKLQEKVTELHICIKNIQSVAKHMADIANITNQLVLFMKPKNSPKMINPYPTTNDHAVLRVQEPDEKMEVLEGIVIPVKVVASCSEIPINHIYYIEDLKQYAINISGVIVKGNLGNIVEYQTERSARCEYGSKCKSFDKCIPCKYYHDPEDYIAKGLPVQELPRNYTVGSWLYSKNKRSVKTYFTRHIGNRATMLYDLAMMKRLQYREEVANREGQLIHDLITYMILHSKGMLERYPHWKKK
jgi:hypothetical protein